MRIVIEYDEVTKQIQISEEDVSPEFAYTSIACYIKKRCDEDMDDRSAAIERVRSICNVASGMVKEKYQDNAKNNIVKK